MKQGFEISKKGRVQLYLPLLLFYGLFAAQRAAFFFSSGRFTLISMDGPLEIHVDAPLEEVQ